MSPGQQGARIAAGFNQDALARKDDMPEQHLADVLELADIYRPSWSEMQHKLRESGVPLNDGPDDPPPSTDPPKTETDPPPSTDLPKTETDPPKTETDPDPNKGELERLRREVAKTAKEKRDRERKEAEAAGEHEKVVKQVEEERDKEKADLEELRAELAKERNGSAIRSVAGRLNFYDTEDAVLRVPSEVAEKGDAAIETFLRDLTKKSPHLVGTGSPRSSASVAPSGGGEGGEQLSSTEGLSPEQIVKATEEGRLDDYLKSK